MNDKFIADQKFEKVDFVLSSPVKADYDSCHFSYCNFSGLDLAGFSFSDCTFEHCDLSNITLRQTGLKEVQFLHCKMVGVDFSACEPFLLQMAFTDTRLDLCSFFKLKLPKTRFVRCSLQEADFAEAELVNAVFDECIMTAAVFDHTNLQSADLRTAVGYQIHPLNNNIRKARFSVAGLAGLLAGFDIKIEN